MQPIILLLPLAMSQPPAEYPPDPPIPSYTLPDLLGGTATKEQWPARREAILELFRAHVYGRVPKNDYTSEFKLAAENAAALNGQATLKVVDVVIRRGDASLSIRLNLFIPNAPRDPVPAFLLICNRGVAAADPTRAVKSEFWPVEQGIARGYAMAVFQNSDVDPDKDDGFKDGIHGLLDDGPRTAESWGTLAAWAWGASRCLDYLIEDPRVDGERVAVIGHSRGGKTALWAAAEDARFALAVSNNSGCGGAALSRRKFDGKEQIARIVKTRSYWFCKRFSDYAENEAALPVDQHMLLALIAPRAVAVGSATADTWADPRGEYLSLVNAAPAFRLFDENVITEPNMPRPDVARNAAAMHYHLRTGKHDLTLKDWTAYWDFADKVLRK